MLQGEGKWRRGRLLRSSVRTPDLTRSRAWLVRILKISFPIGADRYGIHQWDLSNAVN